MLQSAVRESAWSSSEEGDAYNPDARLSNHSGSYRRSLEARSHPRPRHLPITKLNWIPLLSFCEASPGRPSKGSSSPTSRASRAGFRSGIPVAEAIVTVGVLQQWLCREERQNREGSHHKRQQLWVSVCVCGVRQISDGWHQAELSGTGIALTNRLPGLQARYRMSQYLSLSACLHKKVRVRFTVMYSFECTVR